MRKALLAAAIAAVTIPAGPAVAAPPAIVGTNCILVAFAPAGSATYTGVIAVAVTGIDVLEPFENPMQDVDILCELKVNGTTVDTLSRSFPIAAGGVEDTSFSTSGNVEMCTTLSAEDTDMERNNRPRFCQQATKVGVPPDELCLFLPPILCTEPPFPVDIIHAVSLTS